MQTIDKGGVRDDISRRAYELWEQKGRVHGHDVDFWLEAEREIELAEKIFQNQVRATEGPLRAAGLEVARLETTTVGPVARSESKRSVAPATKPGGGAKKASAAVSGSAPIGSRVQM